MTPTNTECSGKPFVVDRIDKRKVVVDFDGGHLSHDGGLALVAAVDRHFGISAKFAECFSDHRDPCRVQHRVEHLLSQRLYGLVQGYEDLNDHDDLRHDLSFCAAVGKLESNHARCAPLSGKSTLNRFEGSPHYEREKPGRYVRISRKPEAIEQTFLDLFFKLSAPYPKELILDLDVTDDATHGNQIDSFFNGYYHHECYAPMLVFCGHHLLAAQLRPSNVDPAQGALEQLQRIIPKLKERWPDVKIIVRGDSAYGREDIMSWCEAQPMVDYVLGLAGNRVLERMSQPLEAKAKAEFERCSSIEPPLPTTAWYRTLYYRTQSSWTRRRRVVGKITYSEAGPKRHYVVTSIPASQMPPSDLHQHLYCPRGDMENRIKEHQLSLFSDRTSTHTFESNQLRLWFSSMAYVLMHAIRQHLLCGTALAKAQLGTIRLKLLKLAAHIRLSVSRVHIALASHEPFPDLLELLYFRLTQLPRPG